MKTILIADDEDRMRIVLSDFLRNEDYIIIEAADGKEALDKFRENNIDLAILDVMMPEYDGWAVCREIRKTSSVPIVMLTARTDEMDESFGFDLGADEYVKKPFNMLILLKRIKAILRRTENVEKKSTIDNLVIDLEKRKVTIKDEVVELTKKEYELLCYFLNNEGIALSRESILNKVWDDRYYGDTRNVDTHVKNLRNKLKEYGKNIMTVRGFGYRFEQNNLN